MRKNLCWRAALAAIPLCIGLGAGAAPQSGGTLVFPVHLGEPNTFDCHATTTVTVMYRLSPHYSRLVKIEPERYPQVSPDLARSWTVSPDGLTYTFTLHDDTRFHDGTPLTANDVRVSYERMRNPPPGLVSMRKGILEDIRSIEAPDAKTVIFRLSQPNVSMLQILAMPYACVYSAKLLAEDPSYPAKRIMGSGPFRFVRYTPGGDWVGERFEAYHRKGLPYLDGFRAPSTSTAAANNALIAGQVHYTMIGMTPSQLEQVTAARADKVTIVGREGATAVMTWAQVNTERPPLNDVRVRRALHLALDRWSGSRSMKQFTAFNMVGALQRPGSPSARTESELEKLPGYARDIEASRREARRLLAEAGHTNLKLQFLNNNVFPFFGVYLVDQLRQIGVSVEHVQVDPPTFFARIAAGQFDLAFGTPPEYLDDPTVNWSVFTSFRDNPANFSRFNDSRFDELYAAQKRERDPAARRVRLRELESHVLDQAYVLPLFWHNWTRAIASDLRGISSFQSTYMKLDLVDLWFDKGAAK